MRIIDGLVKSHKTPFFVIPEEAGIQLFQDVLDPGFRRGDEPIDFLRDHQSLKEKYSYPFLAMIDFRNDGRHVNFNLAIAKVSGRRGWLVTKGSSLVAWFVSWPADNQETNKLTNLITVFMNYQTNKLLVQAK